MSPTLFLSLLFFGSFAHGAPCCSGATSGTGLIVNDDKMLFSNRYTESSVVADVNNSQDVRYRNANQLEQTKTNSLELTTLVSDRWQVGASLPIVFRSRRIASGMESSATGIGDVRAVGAYEFLQEIEYSTWKPRGFIYGQFTTPTGGSTYDDTDPLQTNARGKGFWTPAIGLMFSKPWTLWDANASVEIRHSIPRSAKIAGFSSSYSVEPGWGGAASFGCGYSPRFARSLHLGTALSSFLEEGIQTHGAIESRSDNQFAWEASLSATWLQSTQWTFSLAYADQTLMPVAQNTTLQRSINLSVQHHWER